MPNRTDIAASFEDRLDLSEPDLWDVDQFQGHERMAVSRGNTALERIFKETRTDLPKLMATGRWSVLREPKKKYANAVGLSCNGYVPMETDKKERAMPERMKYTKVLRDWRENGISAGIREQCLQLLEPGEDLYSFWMRIGYDLGHEDIEKKMPWFYNKAWGHRKAGVIMDYLQFRRIVNFLYPKPQGRSTSALEDAVRREKRIEEGDTVWTSAKSKQYADREIEVPFAEFLIALEKDCAVHFHGTMTAARLHTEYGFTLEAGNSIISGRLIDWEIVAGLAEELFPREKVRELASEWKRAMTVEGQRRSFRVVCLEAMQTSGLNSGDIGRLLDIRPPEERIEGYVVHRHHRYRPDANVRNVLLDSASTTLVPVQALLRLVSKDEQQEASLQDVYAQERERHYRRSGAGLSGAGLEMRIGRERAGLEMRDLARHFLPQKSPGAKVRKKDLDLQALERGERSNTWEYTYPQVMEVIEAVAGQKAAKAWERLQHIDDIPLELLEWATVQDMARSLIRAHKSSRKVREMMEEQAPNQAMWLREDLIRDIAEGTYLPKLPALRHLAVTAGMKDALPEEVLRDWHERYPAYLASRKQHRITNPLGRVLTTLIDCKEARHHKDFLDERYLGPTPTHASQDLFKVQFRNFQPSPEFVEGILRAAGVTKDRPVWAAATTLQETGDLHAALNTAVKRLCDRDQEIHPMNCPGFTLEEFASTPAVRSRRRVRGGTDGEDDLFGDLK